MPSASNDNGRALEYRVALELQQQNPSWILTAQAKADQERDIVKWQALSPLLQTQYNQASSKISTWVTSHNIGTKAEIDRLTDASARAGDVADIRVSDAGNSLRLSIKHNHDAAKHQRPSALMQHLGYAKKSQEDVGYRRAYDTVIARFHSESTKLHPHYALNKTPFRELISIQSDFVLRHLYAPMCKLAASVFNNHATSAPALFSFLVGAKGFYKLVVRKNTVVVSDYTSLISPTGMTAAIAKNDPSYILLDFDNGWGMNLRLHTASTRVGKNPSLKFDTQPVKTTIKSVVLP